MRMVSRLVTGKEESRKPILAQFSITPLVSHGLLLEMSYWPQVFQSIALYAMDSEERNVNAKDLNHSTIRNLHPSSADDYESRMEEVDNSIRLSPEGNLETE